MIELLKGFIARLKAFFQKQALELTDELKDELQAMIDETVQKAITEINIDEIAAKIIEAVQKKLA